LTEGGAKADSDNDPEEDVLTLLEGYAVGGIGGKGRIFPSKLEVIDPLHPQPPPTFTIYISSVRYRPTLAMTLAELTSTHGHSWPDLPRSGKFNIGTRSL